MEQYAIYLRKSRADRDAEAVSNEDTLARHERILMDIAKARKLNIAHIYREVVSGDTIAARPEMQKLLQAVESGVYTGVLVVEVERLARGDTIDQGIVVQTFKYSDTKIVTPMKTYDPNNEYDEEYFEFGLFMSRREYKTINRRLQRGRESSVKEGKYVGNKPPYGYEKVKLKAQKGYTLSPVPEEAEIVKLIFELYTQGEQQSDGTFKRLGTALIAKRLNEMGILSGTGKIWVVPTVRDLLRNPTYTGKVRWNWRKAVKKVINGETVISRPRTPAEQCITVEGLHEAIISEDTFNKAQEIMNENPAKPIGEMYVVKNPLSGLVVCGFCGRTMVRRPYPNGHNSYLICQLTGCPNVSSRLDVVERHVLNSLREWVENYKLQWFAEKRDGASLNQRISLKHRKLANLKNELDKATQQRNRTFDLLEQGIYDTATFMERSQGLSEKIEQLKNEIATLTAEMQQQQEADRSYTEIVPKVERLLEVYNSLPDEKAKNDMLTDVIDHAVYKKTEKAKRNGSPDNFEITVTPRLPK